MKHLPKMILSCLLLSGCANTHQTWQLEDRPAILTGSTGKTANAPVMRMLVTESTSYDNRIDLVFGTSTGQRGHYQYTRWSELPASRFHELLLRRLDHLPGLAGVLDAYAPGNEQCDLETVLLDWYHNTDTQPGQAMVSVRATLYRFPDQQLLARHTFRATAPAQRYNGTAAAAALTQANQVLLDQLTAWVSQQASACSQPLRQPIPDRK